MSYFILMGRRIPKQAITVFKFQNETDNIRPFLSIRIRGKEEIIPFGFSVYAKPFLKRVIEYGNGETKVEYDRLNAEKGTYTHWLNCVTSISYNRHKPVMEVECNECTSKLFVDMIKSICKISEQIKS